METSRFSMETAGTSIRFAKICSVISSPFSRSRQKPASLRAWGATTATTGRDDQMHDDSPWKVAQWSLPWPSCIAEGHGHACRSHGDFAGGSQEWEVMEAIFFCPASWVIMSHLWVIPSAAVSYPQLTTSTMLKPSDESRPSSCSSTDKSNLEPS